MKTGKHTVTAVTRKDSKTVVPEGVVAAKVDYDDPSTLVKALEGQEVLVITMGVMAPPEQQSKLIEAAAKAKVPFIIPNEWGVDSTNEKLGKETMLGPRLAGYRAEIEKHGVSSWIGMTCNFWYEFSLGGGPERFGFDFNARSLTYFDDGKTRINTSTWPQCGRAIANLCSLKVLPDDENDKSPYLSQFKNDSLRISSFCISQRDMFESVQRVNGTSDKDWKINSEPSGPRYTRGVELMKGGDRLGFAIALYTRTMFPNGDGNYEASKGLHNDILGLPKEDLDEFTKKGIEFAALGSSYS